MTPLLFRYVEKYHKSGYKISWSEWLAAQEE